MKNLTPVLFALGMLFAAPTAQITAQSDALTPYVAVEGSLEGQEDSYSFQGRTNEPLSFVVTTDGSLDAALTLRDDTGAVLLQNDDVNYPDSTDPLLEAITIPELGIYTITVSAVGGTSGSYTLTMFPGYSELFAGDAFDRPNWAAIADQGEVAIADGQMLLTLAEGQRNAVAVDANAPVVRDFHAQVEVIDVVGSEWVAGMTARQQNENTYYLYEVSERGEWRLSLVSSGGETVLRDWTRHPAIRAGVRQFTLGVMAVGASLDLFYNGEFLGRQRTSDISGDGEIGLVVSTILNGNLPAVTYDNLRITVPTLIDGSPIVPGQLVVSAPNGMVQALLRQQMVGGDGELALNVSESFTEYGRPGVNSLPLASGNQFANLAIGTTIYPRATADTMTGCGLVLRQQDETHYLLAYADATGGYGLSERTSNGFEPGLFAQNPEWANVDSLHLLVIANDTTLHYYVNGQYAGRVETTTQQGGIGNAVVNFEPFYTACSFANTWVWRWAD